VELSELPKSHQLAARFDVISRPLAGGILSAIMENEHNVWRWVRYPVQQVLERVNDEIF
jgi:hypothetical protein